MINLSLPLTDEQLSAALAALDDTLAELGSVLAVPVVELLDPADDADAAEVDLVRAG